MYFVDFAYPEWRLANMFTTVEGKSGDAAGRVELGQTYPDVRLSRTQSNIRIYLPKKSTILNVVEVSVELILSHHQPPLNCPSTYLLLMRKVTETINKM